MNFVAIDFETANTGRDSACSIGLVKVIDGQIVESAVHLIKPPTSHFMFTYIHGLKWEDVEDAPHFGDLWPKINPFFAGVDFMAAHNASFDEGVLKALCQRYGLPMPRLPFHCTVQIARNAFNIYPTKLSNVCQVLEIPLNHHEALSDAMACAQILIKARSGCLTTFLGARQQK